MKQYTKLLTIAGSDSGGGAGIQADLKTFMANGCYGMSVVTAITAQNTLGVIDIHPVPVAVIQSQLKAVLEDIGADAIKIGMLHSKEVIVAIVKTLRETQATCPIVVDPVMVATSGDRLIEDDAIEALESHLFPLATLITPNIPEAEVFYGKDIRSFNELLNTAKDLSERFHVATLVKGGHMEEAELLDVLYDSSTKTSQSYVNKKIATKNSHGTGCTLSSAIAAQLAKGKGLDEAVKTGIDYLQKALVSGSDYTLGSGSGPVNHGFSMM